MQKRTLRVCCSTTRRRADCAHICLVEADELEEAGFGMQSARLCKGLDMLADDVDATVVGCIELRNVGCGRGLTSRMYFLNRSS